MFVRVLILMWLLVLAAGCGRSDRFEVAGQVKTLAGKEVRMVWYDGNGAVCSVGVHADDQGKFKLQGGCASWTLVSLTDADGVALTNFPVMDGESVKVTSDGNGYRLEGTEAVEALTAFRASARTLGSAKMPDAVAAFVRDHRASVASTVVLMEELNGLANVTLADSLFNLIDASARPLSLVEGYVEGLQLSDPKGKHVSGFSARAANGDVERLNFSEAGHTLLIAVGTEGAGAWGDEQIARARREHKGVRVVELTVEGDSAHWQRRVNALKSADSLGRVLRLWVPGGAGYPGIKGLGIRAVPMAVLADSSARVLRREFLTN